MKIEQSYLTENPCYKQGKIIVPKGLMFHSVGCNQPNASVFVRTWNSPTYTRACVHAFIDGNTGTVYQTLPWNYRAWHAGGSANDTHIGVEMCEPSNIVYSGGATIACGNKEKAREVVIRTYTAAVQLFAKLCKIYNLDPLGDGVIISHKEGGTIGIASGHVDPEHLWKQLETSYTMNGFRKDVKNAMGSSENNVYFRVQVGAFKTRSYAVALLEELKNAGFNGFIVEPSAIDQPAKIPAAGAKVTLKNEHLYISATAEDSTTRISGNYFYWDDTPVNGRRRITNSLANVGKSAAVTGWINI